MVDKADDLTGRERYARQCFARARYHLQDSEVESALELMLFEKDMNPDEIKAAAQLIEGIESGEFDIGD